MNTQQLFVSFAEAEAFALETPVITHKPNRLSRIDNINIDNINTNTDKTPSPGSAGLQPVTFADLIGLASSFNKDSAILTNSSQTVSKCTIPSPERPLSPLSDIAITVANFPPPLSTTLQSKSERNPAPFIPNDDDVSPVETESQNNGSGLTEVTIPTSGEEAMKALDPRQYQLEMLEKAIAGNIISVLDTGSGKTLIAVLLIKEIVAKERLERMERRMTKLSVFLVDRVPLVFQQAEVFKDNCDLKVEEFWGERGVDLWGPKQWRSTLEEKDVLVMTAQIFLNMLRHGFISLDRVNLLVFDECHHARRKHSYNCIMREFYDRCPKEERPKIFGMTASPMNSNRSSVRYTASHLEKALDAQIFTVSNDNESLRRVIKRPQEIAVEYDQTPKYEPTPLQTALWSECATASRLIRAFSITSQALRTLGPWCADRLWRSALQEVNKLDIHIGELDDADLLREEEDLVLKRATEIINVTPTPQPCINNTELFAPKVRKLVQILQFYNKRPEDLCGIIFVERRHTAHVLEALIGELKEELGNIKCEMLIGHGSTEDGDISMKYTEQNKVIDRFKHKEINLMIATNVAEEGLDIQACNVVIRFDFFHTLIAYIQSRGRARRPSSKYIVMVEKGNGRELKMLDDVHRMEEEMKKWCEALPADRKAELLSGDEADSDDDDFDPDQSYLIPATRAIVSLNSSVALVHYYCAALPRDSYCNPQPQFDVKPEGNGYICHLTLPSNSPLREVTSELLRSKGMAKRAAALKACILLHQLKALNDHLLPDVENPEEEMEEYRDEKGLLEGSKKRKSHYPKKIPDFWALPEENSVMSLRTLHMTMFKVNLTDDMYEGQEYRTLCLLTRNGFPPIPSFKVYFRSVERTADIVSLMPISLDNDQLDALYRFTMKMCSSIVNRDFVCLLEEIPFLVAPLLSKGQIAPDKDNSELIDWAEIRMGTENYTLPIDPNDLEPLTDAVIIDHADNQRRYFVQRVRRDLNPLSPVPEGVQLRESGYKNFADYYKKVFGLELTLADQPLIEVQIIPKVRNFLQTVPGAAPKQKARVATFVIPEYCRRFPICASVFRSATMLPSLLMRVDAFLAVQELRQAHKLHVDDRLLLEAFTTPSANMEMNYERLETLGDSFLKFVVTIRLYILFPDKHEGQLHSARIRIICNRALYKSAKELRLFERILSMPFNRRLWRPPRFTTKIDDKPEMQETLRAMREHGLSDKTLADVVEASFGAAYLTGGVESALGCCIAMQVPFDQITTWAHFNEAYITDRHKRPARADPKALRTLNVARIEEITGYHFANPLLIAEALTHASLPNSTCPCYQRLEFLGDAILDFLVIRYLFHKYPVAVPGVMTELKDASVNNQILGAICLHIGLHRHVIHFSAKLVGAITQFATAVAKMRERGECTGEYWSELDVPKVLSDVVESMLGAVFVDSGFQIEAVQQVFAKWVEPMLDNHVTPETLKVHPLKTLTTRIQQNGCEGLLLRNHTSSDTDSESQTCTIFIHDHPITRASSNSIRVARKLAAAQANTILDEKPEYLKSVCNCALTRKHRDVDDSEDEDRDGGVGG